VETKGPEFPETMMSSSSELALSSINTESESANPPVISMNQDLDQDQDQDRSIVSHTWDDSGSYGLKLSSVSSDPTARNGAWVQGLTIANKSRQELVGLMLVAIHDSSGTTSGITVIRDLDQRTYTEVLTFLKAAGRPLKIDFEEKTREIIEVLTERL